MKSLFTEGEAERIKVAVREAELRTSGEIVPFVSEQSGRYDVAVWRGASAVAVLSIALALLVFHFYHGWNLAWLYTGWGTALVALVAGTLGALLAAYVPPIKRLLAGDGLLDRNVHARAMEAFVEEEVFLTRERTGILLFISLFERRIEVLGDAGINKLVEPDDWAEVVLRLRTGIRSGKLAEGLVEAIGMCGELLEKERRRAGARRHGRAFQPGARAPGLVDLPPAYDRPQAPGRMGDHLPACPRPSCRSHRSRVESERPSAPLG